MKTELPSFRLDFADGRASVNGVKPLVVLGRDPGCEVVLTGKGVSRRHAEIRFGPGGWSLKDLKSANGIRVNGVLVTEARLHSGDEVSIGPHSLAFEDTSTSVAAAAPGSIRSKHSRVVFEPGGDAAHGVTRTIDLSDYAATRGPNPTSTGRESDWAIRMVSKAAQELISGVSLDEVLESIMDLVFEHLPAERGLLCLCEGTTGERTVKVVRSQGSQSEKIAISESIASAAMTEKQAVLVTDAQLDARFSGQESVVASGIHSAMCAPLYHEGRVTGFIYADSRGFTPPFTVQHLEVLTILSVISAAAVEQTQLRESILNERAIRARLERYSSPSIVDTIVKASRGLGAEMITESVEVSVLFADLVGFTTLAERLPPVEVAAILNEIFDRLTNVVFAFDGTLDKFMGDAIMAIFGAPLAQADHARNAVRAALLLQEQVEAFNETRSAEHRLALRVGINSGQVIAGDIGSPQRKDYTVIGDTVNVASRLEATVAKAGDVVLGERTFLMVKDSIPCTSLGEVKLKGKARGVKAYLVDRTPVRPAGSPEAARSTAPG